MTPAAALLRLAQAALLLQASSAWAASRAEVLKANAGLAAAGDYGAAAAGYIDMVLADPSDAEARAALKKVSELALARENRAVARERAELKAGAARDRRRVLALRAACDRRMKAWRGAASRVVSLAGDADTMDSAVAAYEKLLASAPVYYGRMPELLQETAAVKEAFYRSIKKEMPYLVEGRERVDERDIASLQFLRASSGDDSSRYLDGARTQQVIDRADGFRRLERRLAVRHAALSKGIELYSKGRYAEAYEELGGVLAGDPENEEAVFYSALAAEKMPAPVKGPVKAGAADKR